MMQMKVIQTLFLLMIFTAVSAQDNDRKIQFPDIEGYLSLKCDFHIHSIFSDGVVWPTIRIEEAVRDGLDAISLTEHIEYQPWSDDMPHPDRNRSFEVSKEAAKPYDLLIIPGTEITRDMPPGHANALFVKDVNKMFIDDPYEVYKEASRQGAFVFWNHPNWVNQEEDGIPQLSDIHKRLIKDKLLHGIEVVNDLTFSEEALKIALENDLTVMGTSDIHGLVDWRFDIPNGGHRPISLVFAKEKSADSIKEALINGRTITWYYNMLCGKEEYMSPLLNACLSFKSIDMIGPSSILEVKVTNVSDARFVLQNLTTYDFYNSADLIEIQPHSTQVIRILTEKIESDSVVLKFKVLNAVVGYKKNAEIEIILD